MIIHAITTFLLIFFNFSLFSAQENAAPTEQHPPLPLFIKIAIKKPTEKASVEQIRMFLEDDKRNVEATDIDQSTLLIHAARSGTTTVIKDILAKKPDLNRQGMRKRTAIMCATISNTLAAVKVVAQASPNLLLRDAEGQTVLELAETQKKYGNSKEQKKARQKHEFIEKEMVKYMNTEQTKAAYEKGTVDLNALSLPEADNVTLQFLGDTEKEAALRAKKRRKIDKDHAEKAKQINVTLNN
jgi:hypothetical protein